MVIKTTSPRWLDGHLPPKRMQWVAWPCGEDGIAPGFLHEHMPAGLVPIREFGVPKFKVSIASIFDGILKQMVLQLPFSLELADLSGMVEHNGSSGLLLCVGKVLHKVVIEVNEEGTEAATASIFFICISEVDRHGCRRLWISSPTIRSYTL